MYGDDTPNLTRCSDLNYGILENVFNNHSAEIMDGSLTTSNRAILDEKGNIE